MRAERRRFLEAGFQAGKTFGEQLKAQSGKAGADAGRETGRRFGSELGTALQGLGAFAAARRVQQFFVSTKDAAIEFETAFAGVRKTVNASESEFGAMESAIRDMAEQLPFTAVEIANVAETAGQLGVAKANILDFSKTVLQLGETTNLTSEEAATAFAQIANITGLPQEQFENLAGAVVALGNAGATTERDIVDLALRISGAGRTVGLSTSEVVGFGAALANVGINAEAGGTAISRVFVTILSAVESGGKKLNEFAKIAGTSVPAFAKLFREDAAEATILFVEGLARLQEQGGSTTQALDALGLADIRVSDTIRRLIPGADQLRSTLALGNDEFERGTASSEEFAKRLDTNASQLQILSNRFNETKIQIGEFVAGGLVPVLDVVSDLPAPLVAATALFAGLAATGIGIAAVLKILDNTKRTLAELGGPSGSRAIATMTRLGKVLGGIGIAAVAVEGVGLLVNKIQDLVQGTANVEAGAAALERLGHGADSVQNVAEQFALFRVGAEDVDDLARHVDTLTQGFGGFADSFASFFTGGRFSVGKDFEELDKSLV
ncbi:MAG: phage tail tape measure protein, partial [Thermoleophilaceae bacterium]